jgi:hypothetical protein
MAGLRRLLLRVFNGMWPRRAEADLSRELAAHLAILEDELQQAGLSPEQARAEARRRLGGIETTKAVQRDSRSSPFLDHLRLDVRDALRSIVRHPRATAIALFILASTGAINALILGIADGVLLRPLPYRDSRNVMVMMMRDEQSGQRATMVSGQLLALFKDPQPELSGVGALDSLAPVRRDLPQGDFAPPLSERCHGRVPRRAWRDPGVRTLAGADRRRDKYRAHRV